MLLFHTCLLAGNVNIHKDLACRLILDSRKMELVRKHFRHFLTEIADKATAATGPGAAVSEELRATALKLAASMGDQEEEARQDRARRHVIRNTGTPTYLAAVLITFWYKHTRIHRGCQVEAPWLANYHLGWLLVN